MGAETKAQFTSFGLASLLLLDAGSLAAGEPKPQRGNERKGKPSVLYCDVTDKPKAVVQALKRVYGGTSRLVEVARKDGFAPSRLKGERPYLYDPRDKSERSSPGKAIFAYIVSARGIASDVRLLGSNIPEAADNSLNAMQARWYVPTRLRGQPGASVVIDDLCLEQPQHRIGIATAFRGAETDRCAAITKGVDFAQGA
ncbi:MAG: hypothetical protein ACR2NX_01125 [Chthoniobacterales bacterium]